MKPVDTGVARRNAESKGFVDHGGDHHYLHFYLPDGSLTPWFLKVSRGKGDYPPAFMKSDSFKCGAQTGGLTSRDIYGVVHCELDGPTIEKKYRAWAAANAPRSRER